ncbi:MAG TPA: helix-turn-helix domain-containing protein [Anaeromyxobacteraceae bacterium]
MKPLSEQTLYEILEVPDDAPASEIEKAYQRVRALYGPGALATYTLMAPDEMALLGRRIEEARSVLLDPGARAGYDARLGSGTPQPQAGRTDDSTPSVQATPVTAFVAPEAPQPAAPQALLARPAATPVPLRSRPAANGAALPPPAPAPTPLPATPPFAAVAATAVPAPPAAAAERPGAEVPAARPPDRQVFVPEGGRWTGEMLRRAREGRGLTVAQLAERTKITRHHIENVEAERLAQLPAPVYLRGIVMSVARELRLDGQKVARSYLEHVAAALGQSR